MVKFNTNNDVLYVRGETLVINKLVSVGHFKKEVEITRIINGARAVFTIKCRDKYDAKYLCRQISDLLFEVI